MGRVVGLQCLRCGAQVAPWPAPPSCPSCRTPEFASNVVCVYDAAGADAAQGGGAGPHAEAMRRAAAESGGVWRFAPWLPDVPVPVTLGEGGTPLVPLRRLGLEGGLSHLWLKDESQNPTWSFKDRLISVAMSVASAHDVPGILAASTGNHGASTAAYAARAGLPCVVFTMASTPATILTFIQAYGGMVVVLPTAADCWRMVGECVEQWEWFPTTNGGLPPVGSTPFGLEGYKTIAYEVAASLGWVPPDVMIIPVSAGDGLIGVWRGFQDLLAMGVIDRAPRLIAAEPYAAYAEAVHAPPRRLVTVAGADSRAFNVGTTVPTYHGLYALQQSGGDVIVIDDEAILAVQRRLAATEGIYAEASSVIGVAAALRLAEEKRLPPDASVVCLSTSSGLKDPAVTAAGLPRVPAIDPDMGALARVLESTYRFVRD